MKKKVLFKELKEGLENIQQRRKRKVTQRQYKANEECKPSVTPEIVRELRDHLRISRTVFAHLLCVSPRTLEKWEQGVSKPNMQAAALILLVRKFPDTLKRLNTLATSRE